MSEMFSSCSPEDYYRKADDLVRDSGKVLRDVFRKRWEQTCGQQWSKNQSSNFINGVGSVSFESANDFQKRKIQKGNLEEWDVSLLCLILLSFENTNDEWSKRKSEQDAIHAIRRIRNQVAHNSQKKLSKGSYDQLQKTYNEALSKLELHQNSFLMLMAYLYKHYPNLFWLIVFVCFIFVVKLYSTIFKK